MLDLPRAESVEGQSLMPVLRNKKIKSENPFSSLTENFKEESVQTTTGAQTLTDGIQATSQFDDGYWLGLRGENLAALVDLGRIQAIKKIQIALKKNIHTVTETFSGEASGTEARYIRILAKSIGSCPEWHVGAGEKAWLFADEIIIE
jgi:hypothetical protein